MYSPVVPPAKRKTFPRMRDPQLVLKMRRLAEGIPVSINTTPHAQEEAFHLRH